VYNKIVILLLLLLLMCRKELRGN